VRFFPSRAVSIVRGSTCIHAAPPRQVGAARPWSHRANFGAQYRGKRAPAGSMAKFFRPSAPFRSFKKYHKKKTPAAADQTSLTERGLEDFDNAHSCATTKRGHNRPFFRGFRPPFPYLNFPAEIMAPAF